MKLSTRHSHWLEISVSREGVSNVVVGIGGVEGAWGGEKKKKRRKIGGDDIRVIAQTALTVR